MRVYINFDESAHIFTRETIYQMPKFLMKQIFQKIYFIVKQKIYLSIFIYKYISIFKEIML